MGPTPREGETGTGGIVFTVTLVVTALLVGHVSAYAQLHWPEWKLRRKLRPIPLPGKSREEYETEEFLAVMHDEDGDQRALVQHKPKRVRGQQPLALTSTPSRTTESMKRIQDLLHERHFYPTSRR
jgi:hypothetical protein